MSKGKVDISKLSSICEITGAPGFEKNIRDFVLQEIDGLVDDVEVDNLGNIFALKKGVNNPQNKKVMVAAHLDEIGFMVTHIDDAGFIKFQPLGGFDPKTLTSMRVLVHGSKDLMGVMGSKPIHIMSPEERTKAPKLSDFYIDLGLPKEEVEKIVSVGDAITRKQDLIEIGEMINGKSLDNRLSVYILIETLRKLKTPVYDVYATFTVQEEVGLRGASVAAHKINPDFGLAIDVTIANDSPGVQAYEKVTELGKGTAVKLYDAGVICDRRMVDFLKVTAKKNEISWQPEVLTGGSTDTAGLQRMGKNGAIAGALSIPLRYVHQVTEMAHQDDVVATIDLLTAALEELDSYNWAH